jgi:hypothetical protein
MKKLLFSTLMIAFLGIGRLLATPTIQTFVISANAGCYDLLIVVTDGGYSCYDKVHFCPGCMAWNSHHVTYTHENPDPMYDLYTNIAANSSWQALTTAKYQFLNDSIYHLDTGSRPVIIKHNILGGNFAPSGVGAKVYPSPAQGIMNFEIPQDYLKNANGVTISILDMSGKELIKKNATETLTTIETDKLRSGNYIYKISMGNTIISADVIAVSK